MLVFHILQSRLEEIYFMSFSSTHTAHESYWQAVLIEFEMTTQQM